MTRKNFLQMRLECFVGRGKISGIVSASGNAPYRRGQMGTPERSQSSFGGFFAGPSSLISISSIPRTPTVQM